MAIFIHGKVVRYTDLFILVTNPTLILTKKKQNPRIKRNAMHAYITYMIYTDIARNEQQQQLRAVSCYFLSYQINKLIVIIFHSNNSLIVD
jgi:hypothetical protein